MLMEGVEAGQNLIKRDITADERFKNRATLRASELALDAIARIRLPQRFATTLRLRGADLGRRA
jgi:hypothetical protein